MDTNTHEWNSIVEATLLSLLKHPPVEATILSLIQH